MNSRYLWILFLFSSVKALGGLSTSSSTDEQPNSRQFRILVWTKFFGKDTFSRIKDFKDCSYSNCFTTEDRSLLTDSDAVLFHWRDVDPTDLPQHHKSGQKWVLSNWEPPQNTAEEKVKPLLKDIDWTLSYRKDSDIYSPYGSVHECRREWDGEDFFDNKTKSVAWIVSNCNTVNDRLEIGRDQLKTYIDVDIFGKCGPGLYCPRNETCNLMIESTYKFYLSFENNNCKDYITEKLFGTLRYNIIPVVYGPPDSDYKSIVPKHSYINVKDFQSNQSIDIKALSDYLKDVGSDKQKYNSYLQWKRSYCVDKQDFTKKGFCNLCEKLNQNPKETVVKNKTNFLDWWFKEAECNRTFKASGTKASGSQPIIHFNYPSLVFFILLFCFRI